MGLKEDKSRELMPAVDLGFSWEDMLRFKDVQFKSGGTFKLCFCDSSILPGVGRACATERDYTIEVGMIHASGVLLDLEPAAPAGFLHAADARRAQMLQLYGRAGI